MTRQEIEACFDKWCKKLRLIPSWDIRLQLVEDPEWNKTGDFHIDCDDKKAIILINWAHPKQENLEEVLVHELMHLKLYPLDQVTESLITSIWEEGTPGRNLPTRSFHSLRADGRGAHQVLSLEFGENKTLSFGRCQGQPTFSSLYDGLKNIP